MPRLLPAFIGVSTPKLENSFSVHLPVGSLNSCVLSSVVKYLPTMRHLADIPVLAAAIEAKVEFIVSGNRKHFNPATAARAGIPMYSSSEFLAKMVES